VEQGSCHFPVKPDKLWVLESQVDKDSLSFQLHCEDNEIQDCAGNYVDWTRLGDGICDTVPSNANDNEARATTLADFNCESFDYDKGDCTIDCRGATAPSTWLGDGVCQDGEYDYSTGKYSYNYQLREWEQQESFGAVDFNCNQYDFDAGDCDTENYVFDCSLHGFLDEDIMSRLGDGNCDSSSSFDLYCETFSWDSGDCDSYILDCSGVLSLVSHIGDGVCNNGQDLPASPYEQYWSMVMSMWGFEWTVETGMSTQGDFFCTEFSFDNGDCDNHEYDCNSIFIPDLHVLVGDGVCHFDGSWHDDVTSYGSYVNLNCEKFSFDDGDCDEYTQDCSGNYAQKNQIGNGVCESAEASVSDSHFSDWSLEQLGSFHPKKKASLTEAYNMCSDEQEPYWAPIFFIVVMCFDAVITLIAVIDMQMVRGVITKYGNRNHVICV